MKGRGGDVGAQFGQNYENRTKIKENRSVYHQGFKLGFCDFGLEMMF